MIPDEESTDPFFDLTTYDPTTNQTDENDWMEWATKTLEKATTEKITIEEKPAFELVCEEIDDALLDLEIGELFQDIEVLDFIPQHLV